MNKKLFSILIIICLSSCYSYKPESYQQNKPKPIIYKDGIHKETHYYFFWGLKGENIQSRFYNGKKCGDGKAAKIELKNSFLDYLTKIYTLGIYWPVTLEIECKK
jgi:hypothetical protein